MLNPDAMNVYFRSVLAKRVKHISCYDGPKRPPRLLAMAVGASNRSHLRLLLDLLVGGR